MEDLTLCKKRARSSSETSPVQSPVTPLLNVRFRENDSAVESDSMSNSWYQSVPVENGNKSEVAHSRAAEFYGSEVKLKS